MTLTPYRGAMRSFARHEMQTWILKRFVENDVSGRLSRSTALETAGDEPTVEQSNEDIGLQVMRV